MTGLILHTPVIDNEASFRFPVEPAVLWQTIERLDAFESWWCWLNDVEIDGHSRDVVHWRSSSIAMASTRDTVQRPDWFSFRVDHGAVVNRPRRTA